MATETEEKTEIIEQPAENKPEEPSPLSDKETKDEELKEELKEDKEIKDKEIKKTSHEQYEKDKKFTTAAEENAKYTLTPEPKMGDTEYKNGSKARSKYRKRKKMLPVVLILGAIILVGAFILRSVLKNLDSVQVDNYEPTVEQSSGAKPTPDDGLVIPTPDPEEGEIVEPKVVVQENDESNGERYVFYTADVSWTEAKELAEKAGGHLVTVSDQTELEEIITLAINNGCSYVWIGCHRESGTLIWENSETIEFYKWGNGEPSEYDSGDKVAEDYVLIWKFNGDWVYNDSRDDPCADYADMYSGKIGYVVEFDEN